MPDARDVFRFRMRLSFCSELVEAPILLRSPNLLKDIELPFCSELLSIVAAKRVCFSSYVRNALIIAKCPILFDALPRTEVQ